MSKPIFTVNDVTAIVLSAITPDGFGQGYFKTLSLTDADGVQTDIVIRSVDTSCLALLRLDNDYMSRI